MAKDKLPNEIKSDQPDYVETVIQIKRTSKKTKGGDRMGFTCLSVVGDQKGKIGVALSKAPTVVSAIQKANRKAKNKMFVVPVVGEAKTIPHRIEVTVGASRVLFKPAPAGTGVRAGVSIRSILEAAGIQNIVTKVLGSNNKKGNVDVTIKALNTLRDPKRRLVGGQKSGNKKQVSGAKKEATTKVSKTTKKTTQTTKKKKSVNK